MTPSPLLAPCALRTGLFAPLFSLPVSLFTLLRPPSSVPPQRTPAASRPPSKPRPTGEVSPVLKLVTERGPSVDLFFKQPLSGPVCALGQLPPRGSLGTVVFGLRRALNDGTFQDGVPKPAAAIYGGPTAFTEHPP